MDEIRPLQEALSNPGKSVPAIVNLIPQGEDKISFDVFNSNVTMNCSCILLEAL